MKMQAAYDIDRIQCHRMQSFGYEMEAMHIHDVYEIYMAQCSGVQFFVNNRIYSLEKGDVMLFSHTDLHRVSAPANRLYDRYVLTFSPRLLPPGERDALLTCFDPQYSHRLQLAGEEQRTMIALLEDLMGEMGQTEMGDMGRQLCLARILLFLLRLRRRQPAPDSAISSDTDPRIRRVLDLIDRSYTLPLSLDQLAGACYLNKHYLCRLFRRETGFCIHDYLIYRRLSAAISLLRKGESVSAAARLSGFKSDSFFITTFKKHLGDTPYRYMRNHKTRMDADARFMADAAPE